jgi:hypothetical protein
LPSMLARPFCAVEIARRIAASLLRPALCGLRIAKEPAQLGAVTDPGALADAPKHLAVDDQGAPGPSRRGGPGNIRA